MADGDRKPEGPEHLRDHARATIKDCEDRWTSFRNDWTQAVSSHMTRSFNYFRGVLHPDSEPRDWIKDGIALWIRCYGTGKDLCDATHKVYSAPPRKD